MFFQPNPVHEFPPGDQSEQQRGDQTAIQDSANSMDDDKPLRAYKDSEKSIAAAVVPAPTDKFSHGDTRSSDDSSQQAYLVN